MTNQTGKTGPVEAVLRFPSAGQRDARITTWFAEPDYELRRMAEPWWERMRRCGADVREVLHDNYPTACVEDAPFAYVRAFSAHVNVGFFYGAFLDDRAGILEGAGRRMRHVKLRWGEQVNEPALMELISVAYRDIQLRLRSLE
jgi:hypothetical protein